MNKHLNINCPIGTTGYGITSLNIVKNLYKKNIDISLFLIGNNIELNSSDEKILIQKLHKNTELFDYNSPCLKIWHQNDLALKIGNGDYYSFPFFEIDTLSTKDKHHLNYCDHIFVASEWAKTILINNGIIKPIYVAPLGVDQNIFYSPEDQLKIRDNYIFFHIGKWEKRKGQDFLIKAFERAFDINDNVELWLLPHNPFLTKEEESAWFKLIEDSKLKDKIKVYNRLPTQQHLAQFIFNCDCGVFLSRAEGWNNEIPECMALNKPIITTNYSAHTEYCTIDNSFLVDIHELEMANDGKWFFGEGKWAKLSEKQLEQTIEYMKYVYNNNIRTNENGLKTANHYSWDRTCSIIDNTMIRNNSYANTK